MNENSGSYCTSGIRTVTQLRLITIAGEAMEIARFAVRGLLPDTEHYMTYDGSTTMPACHETTTWIILNKPIYITKQQVIFLSIITDFVLMRF